MKLNASKLQLIFLLLLIPKLTFSQVILIDPGHGGEDCGAKKFIDNNNSGKKKKVCEKDLALEIAKSIQKKLKTKFIDLKT